MDTLKNKKTTDKSKKLLEVTENIETVMGFDPHFQSSQQPNGKIEVSSGETEKIKLVREVEPHFQSSQQPAAKIEVPLSQSAGLFVLWFMVLLVQALMFWKQKSKQ